jgi:hypothetical protein
MLTSCSLKSCALTSSPAQTAVPVRSFSMRNFTGQAEFDDTLPVAEGLLEAGFRVNPERLAEAMGAWFTQREKAQGQPVRIEIRPA